MATLAEIRAKLLSQQQKQESGTRDNSSYPFWNIPDNTTAIIRFLPDNNPNNTFFWVERQIIRLNFSGMDNDLQKQVVVQVPCMEMYNKTCPILSEIRPWFKDPELEQTARSYWKKKSYVFQGFVVDDPLNETDKPENPIRRFVINTSIFNIIKSSLMDPEMEDLPIDYMAGRDFRLAKTRKGQYADYSTSKWSMKTRSLDADEAEAIEKFGLYNLSDFLPKEPSSEEVQIIAEMFQASVDGEPYDSSRWANYFKPNSYSGNNSNDDVTETATPKPATKPVSKVTKPVVEEVEDEDEVQTPAKVDPSEALAKLKARTATKVKSSDDEEPASKPAGKADPSAILEALRNRAKK